MAVQQNFRSAFNGFNREDVVRYIEYLNAKHAAEIQQLNTELEFLRGKQSEFTGGSAAVSGGAADETDVMEQQAARIRELFDQNKALEQTVTGLTTEKEQLTAQLEEARQAGERAETERTRLASQLEEARRQKDSFQSNMEQELEAYRRAERTERLARERAEQLYRQANGALADATVKVDNTANQIGQLSDRVAEQLAELQTAVADSKQALRDAAATMYTIRPTMEEL